MSGGGEHRFAAEGVVGILQLEQVDADRFRAYSPDRARGRVFGGQVIAQALLAAARTVGTAHLCHSMHGYFLRGGDYRRPIDLRVGDVRDGRSFRVRRVTASQAGDEILVLSASFHLAESSNDFQAGPTAPAPPPEELPRAGWGNGLVEIREVPGDATVPRRQLWFRVPGPLPEDPAFHRSAIAYVSDHGPFGAARRAQDDPAAFETMMRASLDHALWFHRPARADDWLLYDLEAVSSFGARVMTRGGVFDRARRRVASVSQEILARPT